MSIYMNCEVCNRHIEVGDECGHIDQINTKRLNEIVREHAGLKGECRDYAEEVADLGRKLAESEALAARYREALEHIYVPPLRPCCKDAFHSNNEHALENHYYDVACEAATTPPTAAYEELKALRVVAAQAQRLIDDEEAAPITGGYTTDGIKRALAALNAAREAPKGKP